MKRSLLFFILLGLYGLNSVDAAAQVSTAPNLINFQGRLAKPDGTPLANGSYSVTFSLWNALSGGTQLWTETDNVTLRNGTFAILLGSTSAFPATLFSGNLWLQTQVGGTTLTPRQQVASVAYALKANTVPDGSIGTTQIANGAITSAKLAAGVGGGASGTAGGDLAGTYPNPTLAVSAASLAKVSGGAMTSLSGNIGIGRSDPGYPLSFPNTLGDKIGLWGSGGATHFGLGIAPALLQIYADTSNSDIAFGYGTSSAFTETLRVKGSGNVGIGTSTPAYKLDVNGIAQVHAISIVGGSDVAEPYTVAPAGKVFPQPGMLVSIDPGHIGRMRVTHTAYDHTVGGIISGANGIQPGITLRQAGTVADGTMPVASIGRVWCWCDADANGAIHEGDLLTTSPTAGHAMRVSRYRKAEGAIIGKAMSPLPRGRGLVLVLVSLR